MSGIGGDGIVCAGLARDLVKLVEINYAVLGFFDVLAGGVIKIANGNFNIRSDKAGFGQARRVRNRKRDVEQFRQMKQQRRLAATRRSHDDHVGLVDLVLGTVILAIVFHALVMIVRGDGENFFGAFLFDDEFIEIRLDDVRLILLEQSAEVVCE